MMRDDGKQGSRPGSTFQEMRQKARGGSLHGKQYAQDGIHAGPSSAELGAKVARAGQGSGIVKKTPLGSPNTGNSPYERQQPRKPGAESLS
jgi:hypothetical protein